jgi:hypothetical protein
MISFAVSGRGGSMSVGREIMKFYDSIVNALWQCVPLPMVCPRAVGCGFRLLILCQLQE